MLKQLFMSNLFRLFLGINFICLSLQFLSVREIEKQRESERESEREREGGRKYTRFCLYVNC